MAYQDVVEVYQSNGLRLRVTACVATEGIEDPYYWVATREWALASAPGWGDAWASGRAAFPQDEDLGTRNDVITDGMILSFVQGSVAAEAAALEDLAITWNET